MKIERNQKIIYIKYKNREKIIKLIINKFILGKKMKKIDYLLLYK